MSDQLVEKTKSEKLYDSLKDLEVMDVAKRKAIAVADLKKIISHLSQIDVSKNSERTKLNKVLEKINEQIESITVIEKVLKEKDF